jgi:spindle assembly abnormal protein 6
VLDLGEPDFHVLRREQSIVVDFLAFPAKLIALLHHCCAGSNRGGGSVFGAKLDSASGLFSVIESNEFKNLTHISLLLRPASDSTLKNYLAARLDMSRDEAKRLASLLREANLAEESSTRRISQLQDELTLMR